MLVNQGADLHHLDSHKNNAIYYAKKYGRFEVVEFLRELGVSEVLEKKEKRSKEEKRKKGGRKDRNKIEYKMIFTGVDLESKDCEIPDFNKFRNLHPEIAYLLMNPELFEQIPQLESLLENHNWKIVALKIIKNLWKIKQAQIFHQPVDVEQYEIPEYYEIVKTPMDFGTIRKKLQCNLYDGAQQFIDDVELVFSNCILFNQSDSDFGVIAGKVRNNFHEQLRTNNFDSFLGSSSTKISEIVAEKVKSYSLEKGLSIKEFCDKMDEEEEKLEKLKVPSKTDSPPLEKSTKQVE